MKKLLFLFLLPASLIAQKPQRKAFVPIFNSVPAAPVSLADVRSQCYDMNTGGCSTEKIGTSFAKTIGDAIQAINSGNTATSIQPDTTLATQLQKMTPEQQRAWAIQYAQQQQAAASASVKLPSAAEKNLYDQYTKLNASEAAMIDSLTQQFGSLEKALLEKLDYFAKQRDEFVMSCSRIKLGIPNPEPDPECVVKGERNYREWLATYSSDWFTQVKQLENKYANRFRTRVSPTETLIISNDYFLNASNNSYTQDAAYVQLLILSEETSLGTMIGRTWELGCSMVLLLKDSYERAGEKF